VDDPVTNANPGKSDSGKLAPVVRRSGKKAIIATDGSDAWSPSRAHRWKRMLEE
jgi:hypothetical protein